MPVLMAAGGSSSRTVRIWAWTRLGVAPWMAVTSLGFWAVIQVMAQVPWTPRAAKVLRSAWIPAPPPLSDPAMVRTAGNARRLLIGVDITIEGW